MKLTPFKTKVVTNDKYFFRTTIRKVLAQLFGIVEGSWFVYDHQPDRVVFRQVITQPKLGVRVYKIGKGQLVLQVHKDLFKDYFLTGTVEWIVKDGTLCASFLGRRGER
jgi:hypothetical protein